MFENLYTTKMSADKKKLHNRFVKIRSNHGRISKLMALIIFAFVLIAMTCSTIILAMNFNNRNADDYSMTEKEFEDFVNRPLGAVMADICYADDGKFVFHYGEGLIIIHTQASLPDPKLRSEFDFVINLKKLNISYAQQGSSVLDIKISKDGQYAYLSSAGAAEEIKEFDKYIVFLDTGFVKKGTMPENAELFPGTSDTFTTVKNPIGWYSSNCIVSEEKIYYLTSETGTVKDIRLVTVDKSGSEIEQRYIFAGKPTTALPQFNEFTPADITDIAEAELVVGGVKINKSYMDNSEIAVRNFFKAFDKSDFEKMKTLVTNEFIAQGYIGDLGMCYGMTKATLETCSTANTDEFLKNYFSKPEHEHTELSGNDVELLRAKSDEMIVYTVIVTAESNIKGFTQPPFKKFLNVICKKQNNGSWLVHKLES